MGAGFGKDSNGICSSSFSSSPRLEDIPENCISIVLMFLDPPEICKLARLNRAFLSASSADFVWESKLPLNYEFLVRRVLDRCPLMLPKKQIYSTLSRPNFFDGGTKEIWLDKRSGKVFLSISSMALKITGIDDRRYWSYIATDESRFESVAYLKQIWWVEIRGELEFEFPPGKYSLYFRLQLGKPSKKLGRRRGVAELDQIHGWNLKPVRFHLSLSNSQKASSERFLHRSAGNWIFYHVGDFVVENTNFVSSLQFSMTQIDCTHTKAGLCVDSVLICPTEFCGLYEHL